MAWKRGPFKEEPREEGLLGESNLGFLVAVLVEDPMRLVVSGPASPPPGLSAGSSLVFEAKACSAVGLAAESAAADKAAELGAKSPA